MPFALRSRRSVLPGILVAGAMLVGACSGSGGDDAVVVQDQSATLAWDMPNSGAATAYRVYFGTASSAYDQSFGAGLDAGAATVYTVTGLARGQTYYFAVTAVDPTGRESSYSNEASKLMQ